MNRGPEDEDSPFSGLEVPEPPPALRGRVLAKAREALAREAARDIWTRVWECRPLRVAWAAAALLLIAAHVVITVRPPAPARRASTPAAPVSDPAGELAAVAGLSPLDEDLLPRLEAPAARPITAPGSQPVPAERNRKESAS